MRSRAVVSWSVGVLWAALAGGAASTVLLSGCREARVIREWRADDHPQPGGGEPSAPPAADEPPAAAAPEAQAAPAPAPAPAPTP